MAGSEDSRMADITENNASLLEDIIRLLEREDRTNTEVIMLIGRSGAGKSALINTLHKALTGNYYQIAVQGSGCASSVTLDFKRLAHCGIRSLESVEDEGRRQQIGRVFDRLPTIIDCAGLGDVNTPALAEILELLVGGFIPDNTQIEALEKIQKDFGVGSLRRLFSNSDPKLVVTKVVFVQGCIDGISKNLIECLQDVLKITDPGSLQRKYTPEIFLVITKYDLVRDPSEEFSIQHDGIEGSQGTISLKDFEEKEKSVAPVFNIEGALEKNRIRWASYTDRMHKDNKHVDKIALEFLKRMVEPNSRKKGETTQSKQVIGFRETVDLYLFKFRNSLQQDWHFNMSPAVVLMCVLIAVILAVFYKLLSSKV